MRQTSYSLSFVTVFLGLAVAGEAQECSGEALHATAEKARAALHERSSPGAQPGVGPAIVRSGLAGTYFRFPRSLHDIPIDGGDSVVLVRPSGDSVGPYGRELSVREGAAEPRIDAIAAATIVRSMLDPGLGRARVQATTLVLSRSRHALRPTWDVRVSVDEPVSRLRFRIAADSGEVLQMDDLVVRARAPATVFDPSPVVALHDASLVDGDDSATAIPPAAYSDVLLSDVNPSRGSPYRLEGPYARALDLEPPSGAPPAEALQAFVYDRADDRFEWVAAYFHIDRLQRFVQSLGFTQVNRRPVAFDAHGLFGRDNSHYVPDGHGTGYLAFGDGGVDDAEDGEVVAHEYAHALQDNQCPNCFVGRESLAVAEGFGYFFAATSFLERSFGFGDACLFEWDVRGMATGRDCARRLDTSKRYPDDIVHEPHADGEIWAGVLWDVLLALSGNARPTLEARDIVLQLAIESHFLLPSDPALVDAGTALLDADALLFEGRHRSLLEESLRRRGLLAPPRLAWGGGAPRTDCAAAFAILNPRNPGGTSNGHQLCVDNDPSCDTDPAAGRCGFRVAVCFGARSLIACSPRMIESWELIAPLSNDQRPSHAALAERLIANVAALPGATRTGAQRSRVDFDPILPVETCTNPIDLTIPLAGHAGSRKRAHIPVRTRTVDTARAADGDALRLACVSRP